MAAVPPMPRSRLSVVTVAFEDLAGLRRTRESVLAQDQQLIEHIVMDGGSRDGTAEWCATQRDLVWRSRPDDGTYHAMNDGAALAKGDLLLFLNSGDRFATPDVARHVLNAYDANGFGWAVGDSLMVDAHLRPTRVHRYADSHVFPFYLLGMRTFPHQATFMRRDLFEDLEGHDPSWGICSDQELLYRAYVRERPFRLTGLLALCDDTGISSRQPFGAFALQMSRIRRAHRRPLGGSALADRAIGRLIAITLAIVLGVRSRWRGL